MKIFLPHFYSPEPDPEDKFRVVKGPTPEAQAELAQMRKASCQSKPFDGQCDECPGGSHPRCTRNLDYWLQRLDEQ